ncbi:MAG TPA: 2-hydroxyhepta-2,4-diene-1,7-dioate isomerase [Bacteroidales bacterium]|nr:2-hydroxyhepta-2,4-diene-1,7-dioate isomerase [Bacteroidales bacterium]
MKIICIGRNYSDHAIEMNVEVPQVPVFFIKPDSCLLRNNQPFFYPEFTSDLQYELEVVLRINRLGRSIKPKFAHRYFDAVTLGIDFTARDLQSECKAKGLPWEISKAFDFSAPIGSFIPKDELGDLYNIDFRLELNGNVVQQGNTANMIFGYDELISYVSRFITFRTGDLLFTGTPSGVGPVRVGDRLQAYLNNTLLLDFFVR